MTKIQEREVYKENLCFQSVISSLTYLSFTRMWPKTMSCNRGFMESWFFPVREGLWFTKGWRHGTFVFSLDICPKFIWWDHNKDSHPARLIQNRMRGLNPQKSSMCSKTNFKEELNQIQKHAVPRCVVMSHSLGLHEKQWDITRTIISLSRSQSNSGRPNNAQMNPGQFANVKYRKWADLKREAAQIEERQPRDQSPPTDAAGDLWG